MRRKVLPYAMLATPQTVHQTGTRAFLASDSGAIRHGLLPSGTGTVTVAQLADESIVDATPSACD